MLTLLVLGTLVFLGLVLGGILSLVFGLLGFVIALPFQILGGVFGLVFGFLGFMISLPFRLFGLAAKGLGAFFVLPFLLLVGLLVGGVLLFVAALPLLPILLLGAGVVWLFRRRSRMAAA